MYEVEFRTKTPRSRFAFNRFPQFHRVKDTVYHAQVSTKQEAKHLCWQGKFHFYKTCWYDAKWARSSSYRANWLLENGADKDGKFRCVYCGRRYPVNGITIDHVVPIDKVKHSHVLRFYLDKKGYDGVNDICNLVPACSRCNTKKGSSANPVWMWRAFLGKYDLWWFFVYVFRAALAILIIAFIYLAATGQIDYVATFNGLSKWFMEVIKSITSKQ